MEQELVLRGLIAALTLVFIVSGLLLRRMRCGRDPSQENFFLLKIIRNLFRAEKRAHGQK
jgi:flagellar biogenesis protein FliO